MPFYLKLVLFVQNLGVVLDLHLNIYLLIETYFVKCLAELLLEVLLKQSKNIQSFKKKKKNNAQTFIPISIGDNSEKGTSLVLSSHKSIPKLHISNA